MLSPETAAVNANPIHSQSLTRIHRNGPHRFKSLTTQLSDDNSARFKNQNSLSVMSAAEQVNAAIAASPSTSNNNLLSPNNILSISNSNLNQYLAKAASPDLLSSTQQQHHSRNHEQTLKLMQKKYSKSVDAYRTGEFAYHFNKFLLVLRVAR